MHRFVGSRGIVVLTVLLIITFGSGYIVANLLSREASVSTPNSLVPSQYDEVPACEPPSCVRFYGPVIPLDGSSVPVQSDVIPIPLAEPSQKYERVQKGLP